MEPDRYQGHHKLYLLGILCLLLGLSLLFFSVYMLPYVLGYLNYDVPENIIILANYFEEDLSYSHTMSKLIIWITIFIPAVLALTISYFISNYIDTQLLQQETSPVVEEERKGRLVAMLKRREYGESYFFALKVFSLMVAVILILLLLAELVRLSLL